ncbi:unnamed protein product [Schistosoma margrebowiei]|uniref:C2H2-type domain-containing protein n=1 Tax=Schistosoma margrebowiei TaxID=48269 RepID=A0AA85AEY7_9TREM|nr:unnamed protein product [Schistosoma margrebowiei]
MKVKNKRPYNRSETCTRSSANSNTVSGTNTASTYIPNKLNEQLDQSDNNNNYPTLTDNSLNTNENMNKSHKKTCNSTTKNTKTRHKSSKHTNSSCSSSSSPSISNNANSTVTQVSGTSLKITHRGGRTHVSSINPTTTTNNNNNSNNTNNSNNNLISNTIRLSNSKSNCCSSSTSTSSSIISSGTNEPIDPYEFAVKTDESINPCGLNDSLIPIKRLKLDRNDERCSALTTDSARSSPMLHTTTINNTNRNDNSFNHSSPGPNSSPLAQSCTHPLSVFTDFSSSNSNNNTITTNNNNINVSSIGSGITRRKSDIVDATPVSTTDNMKVNSSTSSSPHNYYTTSEISANISVTSDPLMSFPTQSKLTDTRAETPSTIPASDPSLCDTTPNVTNSVDKNKNDNTSIKICRNIDTTNDNNQTLSSMHNPSSFTSNTMLNNFEKTHPSETWIISHSPASSSFSSSQPPSPPPPLAMTITMTTTPTTVVSSQLTSNSLPSSSSSLIQSSVKSPLMMSSTTTSILLPTTTSLSLASSALSSSLATTSLVPSSQLYTTSSSTTTTTNTNTTFPTILPERRCTGVNTLLDNSKATLTEPDLLGPCEPGTTICLNGIVWLETTTGVLVVNVTWRGRTYIGTLLDATQHDFAPPCPRDYVPPFKSSIRSSNRTKRRTGVGTNYKSNLTNHLTTNDCNWKSTSTGRHRLRGRASNSPAVNNSNGIETISTTNRCNTHNLTKIDTDKELINDNAIQEDTDLTQCLPHVSDEEQLTRNSNNRKIKLHNKSRKLFRGSSTSSSDCPSEVLPDLEKLSEIGDFTGKTDGMLCDPQNPDHSRPHTPLCTNNNNVNTNNTDNNSSGDHVCFEENDELHETFPIGCPIDGCKKRFSHVLALRFHLNHTSHCNLLDSHKKRPSSIDLKKRDSTNASSITTTTTTTTTTSTNDNKNNNNAGNCSSTHLKCPPTISPCQPSSSSPLPTGITTPGLLNSFGEPLLPSSSSSSSLQQQLKQESNPYDPQLQSCPVSQLTSEYNRDTMSIHAQQNNMPTHHPNYKLYHKNEQKLFDTNISNDYINVMMNTNNDNNSMNNVMHSVNKQRNNEINKHSSNKKRLSTSMSSNNNSPVIDITSLNNYNSNNVRTVTAHTVSVPHGSLDITGNSNSRSNQHQHHYGQQQNHQTNNSNSFHYSKRTTPTSSSSSSSATPRDFSSKHKGGQQSNKLSYQNIKTDINNNNNSTVMNYSRYSGGTYHCGSLEQQSIKSELNNDYMMNLTMCHALSNTTATTTMNTMSKSKNLTVNQQEFNTSLSNNNNNMIPSLLFQNAWNLQLPNSSTYSQSMPLSFNNNNSKDDELKSTMNSLTNGLPSSLYLPTYPNMPTLTSSGSIVNNSPINTMPCSSTPSLSMHEMSTTLQPFNDSKQYIPSNHHPLGISLNTTSNQSVDLNTTTNSTNSMYYGIPDFLVAALSTLASNASSYSCIPEAFKSYFNQNSLMNNTTNPTSTSNMNSNGNSISKANNLSSSNMSLSSNSGILDGTMNNRFFNPQFFQNYGTNLSNVQNFQSFNSSNNNNSGNLTLNPERLDPLKLSAAYLMQYTNPGATQLSSSSSTVTSTFGNSI